MTRPGAKSPGRAPRANARARMRLRTSVKQSKLLLVVVLAAHAPMAAAYVQDVQLERQLYASDPRALARLPAKGFKDGLAGFFRTHGLVVVPHSERAWCQNQARGSLPPGCYVEFFFQARGRKGMTADGSPCGLLGRWYRTPDTHNYVPTPGAYYSIAMAEGDWENVVVALHREPKPACG
jgi:hypothetical protein